MKIIYNIGIHLYYLLVFIFSFFNKKAKLWIDGRKNIFNKIEQEIQKNTETAWFHCSSLGEFEQARPVLEAFKKENADYKILLTFFSPSGYEFRKNYTLADYIYYLPIDSPKNAKRFIANYFNPSLTPPRMGTIAFFTKNDIWPNYINELKKKSIPTYLISANFNENQIYFKWYGKWFLKSLKRFNYIFTQNENTTKLLKQNGIENIATTGDTRFDKVFATAQLSEEIEIIEQFKNNEKTIILGSSWKEDEEVIINAINNYCVKNWKCIIAPHEVDTSNIERIEKLLKIKSIRFSEMQNSAFTDSRVLIIDNIGMLSKIYRHADIAYIGGAFGSGLHNILEPATFGLPVIFGPNHTKFPEGNELIKAGGSFSISNSVEFETIFKKLIENPDYLKGTGENSKNYVLKNLGSTEKIMKILTEL